jgi:hypothetical protein
VALAREVEQLRERLVQLDAVADDAKRTAEAVHRVLPELADRVAAVAGDRTELANRVSRDEDLPSWLANELPEMLVQLQGWLDHVLIHYPDTAIALGVCWPLHPWIVEELLALRAVWFEAYQGERVNGTKAVDWHDRLRPGVLRRIREHTAGCSPEAHRPGGRLGSQPRPLPKTIRMNGNT